MSDNSSTVVTIEPRSDWGLLNLRELWEYRELLGVLALRDIRVRYKQTVLGASWAVLRPALTMVIFTLVFGRWAKVPSEGFPYPVFVYSGLLPWLFFTQSIGQSANSLVGSASLISKVYFPRVAVPLASIGTSIVDFFISLAVFSVLLMIFHTSPTWRIAVAPFFFVLLLITIIGLALMLSALTVTYRDLTHGIPFLVQIWLYVTPVIYPVTLIPEQWRWLLWFNPMAGIIQGIRWSFLGTEYDPTYLVSSVLLGLGMLLGGSFYFRRVERRFADVI